MPDVSEGPECSCIKVEEEKKNISSDLFVLTYSSRNKLETRGWT